MTEGTFAADGQFGFAHALTLAGKLEAPLAVGPVFEPLGWVGRRR
jgi:hypothetical protein